MAIKNKIAVLVGILTWSFGVVASNAEIINNIINTSQHSNKSPSFWTTAGYTSKPDTSPKEADNIVELTTLFKYSREEEKIIDKAVIAPDKVPFATHSLIIIPEAKLNDSCTSKTLDFIFKSRLLVLFSATVLNVFIPDNVYESKHSNGYYFFGLPGALESNGKAFVLGIPQEMLENDLKNAIENPKTKSLNSNSDVTATEMEKKLGILITQLQYLGTAEKIGKKNLDLHVQTDEAISEELKNVLSNFFVPKELYKNKIDIPRWIIVIDGHGGKATLHKDVADFKNNNIVKSDNGITHLKIDVFAQILEKIRERTHLMLVHIASCWNDTIKLTELAKKLSSLPPILTSMSLAGNGPINGILKEDQYQLFLKSFTEFKVKGKDLTLNDKLCKKIFNKFTNAAQYLQYTQTRRALGDRIPVFKAPTDPSFWPVTQSNSTDIVPAEEYTPLKARQKPFVILMNGSTIEKVVVTMLKSIKPKSSKAAYPYFSARIPGAFSQTIEKLIVPNDFKDCAQVLTDLFPEMFKKRIMASYCVHIKNIKGLKDWHHTKIYAKGYQDTQPNKGTTKFGGVTAIFSYKKTKNADDRNYVYFDKLGKTEATTEDNSKKAAKSWIKTFKDEMKNKKKLGKCMNNYLLKK